MKIYFKKNYLPSMDVDTAVVLQVEKYENSFGLEAVDPKGVAKKSFLRENFKGVFGTQVKLLYPEGSPVACLQVMGLGKQEEINDQTFLKTGGLCFPQLNKANKVVVFADALGIENQTSQVMHFALGLLLRSYSFKHYHTQKTKNEKNLEITFITENAELCQKEFDDVKAILGGVNLTKELVNEPANILGTNEFVERTQQLQTLGVEVEVLNKETLEKLGMNALLGVAQGSQRPPYLVVMKWLGGNENEKPVAFVGKGVVFDTGGISLKPSNKMEDMKGDMAGAATVVGLMHALAARKAKVNVLGVIGLVENMPGSNAQRPGDIVTSMSGQTIEVINTDAEGRLVLADALWYCKTKLQPKMIIDLATLTGAIVVALGYEYAGLFSNNKELVKQLVHSGEVTEEKVWQFPLGPEYDRLVDGKFADISNCPVGYGAGSITAAQFLKRFVGDDIPWAHIDIAGVASGKKKNEFNSSWASGFGVRLLNHLVKDYYENK
ncbi:Leucyl aminopeptidase [Candidatus Phytoplasma australiense]|uniref:Probable cytosol aminopeptidase n=2 Tax=Phytoplasma australiense TaxID=59748 RepID=AMPA_PHYAS|nr:leucyl aminopeptidase [Candidatus Phytoplasma australiense]B1V932.1 RecName: Full=Probable cytosol aminopeptidase; AltName: Full=Leucine aminopeptidase; Short=LAP; AltName: Full=Leucyl aminopeptidase [Candidatus Phytoplasma australiense]AGL90776.1 putative cytosol aminopeptidase [Strawberry lethal yellows phytoplasma (CPA) str. NZSb11]CAM11464.1 Leucyl aminopeptidase [Candidatus Phytoplasma australiense]